MLSDKLKVFFDEAINIGDEVIQSAIKVESGIYWEVHNQEGKSNINLNFYSGNPGILYFLLQLYKITKARKYYDALIQGCQWLKNCDYTTGKTNLSFYVGLGGVAYILNEVYKITNDDTYKKVAEDIVLENMSIPAYNNDILIGHSGKVLTLLYFYNENNDERILDELKKSIDLIVTTSILSKSGLCWDRSSKSIHALCGFAHGASGVAFIFTEVFKYFQNPIFYSLAQQAYNYESQYYNSEKENWPDFRKDMSEPKFFNFYLENYKMGNISPLIEPMDMFAWCHGGPGIAMAHLYSFQVTKEKNHLEEYEKCIKKLLKTLKDEILFENSFTICHGLFGNLNLLIDGYLETKNNFLYETAIAITQKALNYKNKKGFYRSGFPLINGPSDSSLFMGLGGIGHFYIRLCDPNNTPSILIPNITQSKKNVKNDLLSEFNNGYISKILIRKIFENTFPYLQDIVLEDLGIIDLREKIVELVQIQVKEINDATLNLLFELDLLKMEFSDSCESDVLLAMKLHDYIARIPKSNQELLHKEIIVSPEILLTHIKFDSKDAFIILQPTMTQQGVHQYEVGEFIYTMLNAFKSKSTVQNAFDLLSQKYDIDNGNLSSFYDLFFQKVIECLKNVFLIVSN